MTKRRVAVLGMMTLALAGITAGAVPQVSLTNEEQELAFRVAVAWGRSPSWVIEEMLRLKESGRRRVTKEDLESALRKAIVVGRPVEPVVHTLSRRDASGQEVQSAIEAAPTDGRAAAEAKRERRRQRNAKRSP